jgi:putative addiction module component (TIGR02574 family)
MEEFRMHNSEDIIRKAAALPIEERARIVDSLLRTLNAPDPKIDQEWIGIAKQRLSELRSGKVRAIPVEEVFARIRTRFAK